MTAAACCGQEGYISLEELRETRPATTDSRQSIGSPPRSATYWRSTISPPPTVPSIFVSRQRGFENFAVGGTRPPVLRTLRYVAPFWHHSCGMRTLRYVAPFWHHSGTASSARNFLVS